ncbi:MAG: hypothetical protein EXR95_06385 [Gemmatimonadetes bacterium]|nr:hypothetical protein [Gemmatimonadota bacterium]
MTFGGAGGPRNSATSTVHPRGQRGHPHESIRWTGPSPGVSIRGMPPAPSSRLTTIWFADIAWFTRLSATDEPLALRVMDVMRHCVKVSVGAEHGTVIKYLGDGALAEFSSAEGAVAAALDAHARFIAGTSGFKGGPYKMHTGIHVGDVTVSGGDIFGDGVNRAARIQSLGEAGEIIISEEVHSLVRRRPEIRFASLGERTAKGLDEPFYVFSVEPTGDLALRLDRIEKGDPGAVPAPPPVRLIRYTRAIGTGIFAGVVTMAGIAVWTAIGGEPAVAPPVAIPDTLKVPAHDAAFAMPAWPAPATRTAASTAAAEGSGAARSGPATVATLAQRGERYLRGLTRRDLTGHEVLPLLRRALNEARDGGPTGARAEAIRRIAFFMVARDPARAEAAFHSSIAADEKVGLTRVMYAQMLTAEGRFGEAAFQLKQANGKGVSNALFDATRGALLFRRGDFGDARGALDRSPKSEDLLSTRILLARAQIAQNKVDDALRTLDNEDRLLRGRAVDGVRAPPQRARGERGQPTAAGRDGVARRRWLRGRAAPLRGRQYRAGTEHARATRPRRRPGLGLARGRSRVGRAARQRALPVAGRPRARPPLSRRRP